MMKTNPTLFTRLMLWSLFLFVFITYDISNKTNLRSEPTVYEIDISRTYEMDGWKYVVEHLVPPGHRYHNQGRLFFKDREVEDGQRFNDFLVTPVGTLYWVGLGPGFRYNPQGWMREPDPRYPLGTQINHYNLYCTLGD